MLKRDNPKTPATYHDVISKIIRIAQDANINVDKCDFFEEVLLLLAGVKEKPKACNTAHDPVQGDDGNVCLIAFAISREAMNQFLEYLKKFPNFSVEEVTEKFTKNPSANAPLQLDGNPTIILKINTNDLDQHIFPLFEKYVAENLGVLQERYYGFRLRTHPLDNFSYNVMRDLLKLDLSNASKTHEKVEAAKGADTANKQDVTKMNDSKPNVPASSSSAPQLSKVEAAPSASQKLSPK